VRVIRVVVVEVAADGDHYCDACLRVTSSDTIDSVFVVVVVTNPMVLPFCHHLVASLSLWWFVCMR
jgi:hypothetical protein